MTSAGSLPGIRVIRKPNRSCAPEFDPDDCCSTEIFLTCQLPVAAASGRYLPQAAFSFLLDFPLTRKITKIPAMTKEAAPTRRVMLITRPRPCGSVT